MSAKKRFLCGFLAAMDSDHMSFYIGELCGLLTLGSGVLPAFIWLMVVRVKAEK